MKFQQHEFRVSSFVSLRRDFSIFRSFSLSLDRQQPSLLSSFTFLSSFPLSPIHSSSPPFTLSFLSAPLSTSSSSSSLGFISMLSLSLSLCRSSFSPALDAGNAVPLSRAERCGNVARAGVRRAQGRVVGTVGKFSCRRLCARRQWCSPPPSLRGILLDFLLSRSKSVSPRTQKKKGGAGRRGKKVYH